MCREDWTDFLHSHYDEDDEDDEEEEEDEDQPDLRIDDLHPRFIILNLIQRAKEFLIEDGYTENHRNWHYIIKENVIHNISTIIDEFPRRRAWICTHYGIENGRQLLIERGYGDYSDPCVMAFEILHKIYKDIQNNL